MQGSVLAGYHIVERIGRGGMSNVYRATQPHVERDVAIKVIAPELVGMTGFVERFLREATIAARVQHPHVLPIYDVGVVEGHAYIVMAYMAGGSLHSLIQGHPTGLPLARVLRVVRQVAEAIDALHDSGITHADIKPGNIMLDDHQNAYLGDFGIARVGGDVDDDTPGTYAYAAPEVAAGQPQSQLADIYALGVVTFEMLTGDLPYAIHDKASMQAAHTSQRIPSVSAWRPDLPHGVALAVRQAMHRQPNARPRTAVRYAAALEGAAQHDVTRPHRLPRLKPPAPAVPVPPAGPTKPSEGVPVEATVRSRRVLIFPLHLVMIVGLLLLLAGILITLMQPPAGF